MTRLLLLPLALYLCAPALSAQVLINEISAANMTGLTDSDGDREDWVELYNSGATTVNLSGWFLTDNPNKPKKWTIPNGQSIAPGAYRIVFCSGKDKVAGASMHTNFKISQTKGESLVLTRPNNTTADAYTFDIPNQGDHSYGRAPNGGTVWKIYTTPTPGAANSTNSYTAYGPDVAATPDAGFYGGSTVVSLSTDAGFEIRYTTDGTEPIATSPTYSAPLDMAATAILKARAFSSDPQILPGFVTANTYFINVSHTIPVVSIAGNNLINLLNGTQNRPFGSFEYFKNNELKDEAYGEFNKHGNDSWAYPQRGIDWITRDQLGYKDELKHKFFKERDRDKFQRLILKAAANDNYPAAGGAHIRDSYVHTLAVQGGLNLDVRTHRSCVLYVNGQYWGVYDLREKVDDSDFTSYYYDQDEPDVDYIKTWGATWAEYGSIADWNTLKAFILGNNMANTGNYNYVLQQFDLLSLVDYVIINQHSVCKDWLNWNTSWWRGRNPDGTAKRWRYTLWDMDATFGHYINYTGIPNTGPTADPCDVEDIPNSGDPQNHIDIFMALMVNPEFKSLYINRYAELLNTSLSCASMNALLDSMTNTIAPEMAQQCARWGGTVAQWNQNVNAVHDFINTHCQLIDQSMVDCYDVAGPFQLTVNIAPAASPNQVTINNITPTTYPFAGDYFGGVSMNLSAQPAIGWLFDHWEVSGNSFGPDQFTGAIQLAFATSGVVTAFFVPAGPCEMPTGLAVSNPAGTPSLNWMGEQFASSYLIQYRKTGELVWSEITTTQTTWNFDSLPGCNNYDVQIQSVCPHDTSDFVGFAIATPDYLPGTGLNDAVICNSDMVVLDATFPGATYQWNDGSNTPTQSVSDPGDFWVTIQLNGCTKTDTAHVVQVNATTYIQPVLCPGEAFLLQGETFDEQNPNGQVVLQNMAVSGCDSIVNVSLLYLTVSQSQAYQKSCDPAAVGVDTLVLTNFKGCDSLVVTTTEYAPFSQILLTASSCNPNLAGIDTLTLTNHLGCDSLVITTTSFDPSAIPVTSLFAKNCDPAAVGVDTLVLTNFKGCDSLVVTTTEYAPFSQILLTASSCNPNLAGIDTLTLTNHLGCDSLVITATSFDPSAIPVTSLFAKNCDPAAVGVDTLVLTNFKGCDSLVVTTTEYAPFSQILLTASSCNPNLTGIDTLMLTNHLGCDSLVITTTSFDPSAIPVTSLFAKNCDPAAVGVDTLVLTNFTGCDSLVVTTTEYAPFSQILLTASSCNPNLTGIDTLILTNHLGCDSLVITATSFDPSAIPVTSLFAKDCDPAAVGVDTLVLTNFTGCDSLVVTTTEYAPFSQILLTASSCNPNLAGIDTLMLTNHLGCDSLVITTTSFDPSAIPVTSLFVKNCDPAAVGVDTLVLTNFKGCDSLVVTTTEYSPFSQILLTASSCNPNLAGIDTLILSNHLGCDSLVITTVTYTGLDFEASTKGALCFDGDDGFIQLDTVLTPLLPVELVLENHPVQFYTGTPLVWDNLSAGTYSLLATNSKGCTVARAVHVDEGAPLQLAFDQASVAIHLGDSVWVEPISDFQIATAAWLPTDGLQCPGCPATFFAPLKTARYTLTASDPNGCSTNASLVLEVEQDVRVYVPNAIHLGSNSPNANLVISTGPEVEQVRSFQMFDRWGNKIFEQKDVSPNAIITWDGTFRGKLLGPGVIIWFCEIKTIDEQVLNLSGDITVLR